jgi:hypothetical protein
MSLPVSTAIKEDALPLQRALRALEDARKSLKAFARTASVEADASLATTVKSLRRQVKKARRLGKEAEKRWTADAVS